MNLVEFVNNLGDMLEQGDVVVIAEKQTSNRTGAAISPALEVDLSDNDYDTRVCGVVCEARVELHLPAGAEPPSSAKAPAKKKSEPQSKAPKKMPNLVASSIQELDQMDRTKVGPGQSGTMVVLGVFAHCKVDADTAPIEVGDLLTTSSTKGHAQRVLDPSKATGAILGKALGGLKKGKGKIPVMVTLQ